jgi:hypothetical protein
MLGTQSQHSFLTEFNGNSIAVPAHGLNQDQHAFFMNAAKEHAGDIASMLPEAMKVVKFAAGFLGILAIGCSVAQSDERSNDRMCWN